MWVGSRVDQRRLKQLAAVLDKFRDRLGYTLHLPGETNMFDVADLDYHQALLEAGLEVGKALGATAMAYHAGYRLTLPAGTSKPMQELMARERDIAPGDDAFLALALSVVDREGADALWRVPTPAARSRSGRWTRCATTSAPSSR